MAEQQLNRADIGSGFEQVNRKGVPQCLPILLMICTQQRFAISVIPRRRVSNYFAEKGTFLFCVDTMQNALALDIPILYNAPNILLPGVDWGYLKTAHNAEGCRFRSVSGRGG